jgi:hypothetical protein
LNERINFELADAIFFALAVYPIPDIDIKIDPPQFSYHAPRLIPEKRLCLAEIVAVPPGWSDACYCPGMSVPPDEPPYHILPSN